MMSEKNYKQPSAKPFEIQNEGVICDSDVIVTRPDYGEAEEGEW